MESQSSYLTTCAVRETRIAAFDKADRALLLRGSQLFGGLSGYEVQEIADRARPRSFGRSELLFMQGQPFRQLILVESGCVKLTRLCPNGNEVILGLRGAGDAIDLPAGPTFCNHTYSAQALVSCTTLTWEWSLMEKLMATAPRFSRNVCCILTHQLHELQEYYHELSTATVGRRLACALIRMAKQFGRSTARGVEISVSRQELAQMTGTTLFTVSRLIAKWGKLGLILPRREAILMLDLKRLDLLSSMQQQSPGENVFSSSEHKHIELSALIATHPGVAMTRRGLALC